MLLWTVSVPSAGKFGDHVAGGIDHVGVVAGTTDHGVIAGAAIEHVVACKSLQGIVTGRPERCLLHQYR